MLHEESDIFYKQSLKYLNSSSRRVQGQDYLLFISKQNKCYNTRPVIFKLRKNCSIAIVVISLNLHNVCGASSLDFNGQMLFYRNHTTAPELPFHMLYLGMASLVLISLRMKKKIELLLTKSGTDITSLHFLWEI